MRQLAPWILFAVAATTAFGFAGSRHRAIQELETLQHGIGLERLQIENAETRLVERYDKLNRREKLLNEREEMMDQGFRLVPELSFQPSSGP